MGFGPEIAHYVDRHGTRWRFAALPLGGYVRFHGDANGASDDRRRCAERRHAGGGAGGSVFRRQEVWKRAAMVAAGPVANFILALGDLHRPVLSSRAATSCCRASTTVVEGGPAAAAGFQKGDLVLAIDGVKIDGFSGHAAHRHRRHRRSRCISSSSATARELD